MSWSVLPDDVVEVILAKFSFDDLARVSRTCRTFHTLYQRLMAVQQEARCDLAFRLCDRERIACIIALIAHLLEGRPSIFGSQEIKWSYCSISADGVLHRPVCYPLVNPFLTEAGAMKALVCMKWCIQQTVCIIFETELWEPTQLIVQISHARTEIEIIVIPTRDDELHMVALLQALLSEGLSQLIHDAVKRATLTFSPFTAMCTGWD
jgi:hypothetical protein